jgi:hypothetical protein
LPVEYDLTKLGPGIRGKYYRQATAGTSIVLVRSAKPPEGQWNSISTDTISDTAPQNTDGD